MTKTEELKKEIEHHLWNNEPYMSLDMCATLTNSVLQACKESGLHWEIDWMVEEIEL